MKFETSEIDTIQLLSTLRERYPGALCGAATVHFCPLGEDAWCYRVHSDTAAVSSCFVRIEAEAGSGATLERLEIAGAMTEQLQQSRGMHGVVAPLRDCSGSMASAFPPRFVLQVFPYISGEQAMAEDGAVRDEDRLAAIRFVARLHYYGQQLQQLLPPSAIESVPREKFAHGHAPSVQRAMAYAVSREPDFADDDGSECRTRCKLATCRALVADQSGIEWLLHTLSEMEKELLADSERYDVVLTHSECHLANFVRSDSDGSLHCVDWGDLALGPRERDLALLCCDDLAPMALHAYVGASSTHTCASSCSSRLLAVDPHMRTALLVPVSQTR